MAIKSKVSNPYRSQDGAKNTMIACSVVVVAALTTTCGPLDPQETRESQDRPSMASDITWRLGLQGASCTATCQAHGQTCSAAKLKEVDTASGVQSVAGWANAQKPCKATYGWNYATNPGQCTASTCCGGACVGACAYGTGAAPSCDARSASYSRYCPCEARACVPSCSGRECGSDGCGGSCGSCKGGVSCSNGHCAGLPSATAVRNSVVDPLPGNKPTACEWDWTIRQLHYMPKAIVPRRMYFSSCNTQSPNPEMFVSLSVGLDAGPGVRDATSGALVRARLNPSTGVLEKTAQRHFPECLEMHGIATSGNCSTVAALCRIPSGTPGADKDSLATHPDAAWMTRPNTCGGKMNDEMWLYEWKNGDILSQPKRYIVHKAIGSWETGNNYLQYGENDNTYGIAVKATVGSDAKAGCHEADAFLMLDRADYSMPRRGWSWACGTGHTSFNRPAFDPTTRKHAMMCSTDYNSAQIGGLGSVYFRREDSAAREFHRVNVEGAIKNKGGASALLARPGGGFIGVLVGVNGTVVSAGYPKTPPTSIGMVQFGADGTMQGGINWVVQNAGAYVSYPQLVSLGSGRYLLGWGVMKKLDNSTDTTDESLRIPWEYWVVEIDATGKRLANPTRLTGAGWGEQDQLVPLGQGRAAWAYIKDPALTSSGAYPSCNSSSLQLSVYVSGPG